MTIIPNSKSSFDRKLNDNLDEEIRMIMPVSPIVARGTQNFQVDARSTNFEINSLLFFTICAVSSCITGYMSQEGSLKKGAYLTSALTSGAALISLIEYFAQKQRKVN